MNLKLKVCGMRDSKNLQELEALKPDYLGLIFYERSSRYVKDQIPPTAEGIKRTGVFVNTSTDDILKKQQEYKLSAIQLHGDESPEFCKELKMSLPKDVEVIKVFSVGDDFDLKELEPYGNVVDLFLFDTKGKKRGGNGTRFDWELLKNYDSEVPFFLSGGIGLEEIPAIKELYEGFKKWQKQQLFYGIDVNSRFETAPAHKDINKIKLFREQLFS
jgi:phosphoribosylanthranilate isomerase